MAAISAAHPPSATTTTITPPSSGHEDRSWDYDNYRRIEVSSTYSCSTPSGTIVPLYCSLPAQTCCSLP